MADESLVFYTNPMSRGRIARWMLEEVGVPYRCEVVGFGPEMRTPEYLALNPLGKVPTIVHDGTVVTEAAAVCAYLADAFPAAGLAPDTRRRGDYYRWMFFASGPLEAVIINRSLGFDVPDAKRGQVGFAPFETMMDALEMAVSRADYIAGDSFSAADVYVGSQVGWGMMFGTIEPRPAFKAYWERLEGREARQRASRLDDEAAAAMKAVAG